MQQSPALAAQSDALNPHTVTSSYLQNATLPSRLSFDPACEIDRVRRAAFLDAGDFAGFEREYGCILRSDVVRLWQCPEHVRFPQKGEAWLRWRDTFGPSGSRVDKILGYNKRESRRDVFIDYCGLNPTPFLGNAITEHGNFWENTGIWKWEQDMAREGGGVVVTLPFDCFGVAPHYAYSPDGITHDGHMVEHKAPALRRLVHDEVPIHYEHGQVQYGLFCMEKANYATIADCYYIEYKPPMSPTTPDSEDMWSTLIPRDDTWAHRNQRMLDEFWQEVKDYRATGVMPDHYVSEARYQVWMSQRISESSPLDWPRSLRSLESAQSTRRKAIAAAAEKRRSQVAEQREMMMAQAQNRPYVTPLFVMTSGAAKRGIDAISIDDETPGAGMDFGDYAKAPQTSSSNDASYKPPVSASGSSKGGRGGGAIDWS